MPGHGARGHQDVDYVLQTEEIGFNLIATAKISNKFS